MMQKYNKYSNKKIEINGIKFDSKKEAKRYEELKLLQIGKKISGLTLQPSYVLQNAFKLQGETHRAIKYVADFSYMQNGVKIVEDVKGYKTDIYKLKKKLFLKMYGESLVFKEI